MRSALMMLLPSTTEKSAVRSNLPNERRLLTLHTQAGVASPITVWSAGSILPSPFVST